MTINQKGIDLIKHFEGFYEKSYLCPAKVWTIGYGTTKWYSNDPVKSGQTVTKSEAENLLKHDLTQFEKGVISLVKAKINENQFSALVSFAYNVGLGALAKSTLLKMLNAGAEPEAVAPQFLRWNKAGGQVLAGLTRRREAEANLFLS